MGKRKNKSVLPAALLLLQLFACSGVKHLAEGEKYYTGAKIKFQKSVKHKDQLTLGLNELLVIDRNAKILGSRPGIFFYHLVKEEPDQNQSFKRWLKYKLGSAPVLMSDVSPGRTSDRLKNYLLNQGFFNARVTYEVKTKKHEGSIVYSIHPHQAYKIRNIYYPETDSVYADIIAQMQKETLLDSGMRYRLELLKEEQKRIEDLVEDKGFFYFDDRYLIYRADSTVGDHQVDLTLMLDKNTPEQAKRVFLIDSLMIYPNYSFVRDTSSGKRKSVVPYNRHYFVNDPDYIRKDILTEIIILEPDSIYTHTAESYTLEHLLNLGVFKYVNIKFDQIDSAKLSPSIYMTPFPKKSIQIKAEGISKSNNFAGPAIGITFSNRNTFRGGELLEVNLNGAYNIQVGGQSDPPLTAYELGLKNSLTFPRIISPFNIIDYHNWRYLPSTRINLGARLQERLNLFRLNSFDTGYGFLWRTHITRNHEFYPVSISYVQLASQSASFSERLENDPVLFRSIQDQFIIGGTYSYTFNTKLAETSGNRWNNFYLNARADISGNLLYGTQSLTGIGTASNGNYQLLNRAYAQYAKGLIDFRYYRNLGMSSSLATRLLTGTARAYLNADEVPFIKQFSAGGSNDIRAFHARSLGPGAYYQLNDPQINEDSVLFFDKTGDIKLLANIEYRTKIIGVLEGALFLDAGNIWIWDEQNKPGGAFRADTFYRQIALGTGVGLRFDFSFFILRFDLAFPLHNPRRPQGDRWVFDEINPLDSEWRQDNLILNIGIGYPF